MNNKLKLNPFMRLRFEEKPFVDLFLENQELELNSYAYLELFALLNEAKNENELIYGLKAATELEDEEIISLIQTCKESKLIVNEDFHYSEEKDVNHWLERGWIDALMYHMKSRNISFLDEKSSNPEIEKNKMMREVVNCSEFPEIFKSYKDSLKINLPQLSSLPTNKTYQEILLSRRSLKPWKSSEVPIEYFSNILGYSNQENLSFRKKVKEEMYINPSTILNNSSFSALETYVFAFNIQGILQGLYHYDPLNHELQLVRREIERTYLSTMCIGQKQIEGASFVICISAIWKKYQMRYQHPRAYRNLFVNIGELAQKYLIMGAAYDYTAFMTPALVDEYVADLLGVNLYKESPLYVVGIG